jgi:hypothetical protein
MKQQNNKKCVLPPQLKKMMGLKGILSTLLLISFTIVMVTGIMLTFKMKNFSSAPMGLKLHIIFGFIMGILVLIHFVINFGFYKAEMKCLVKEAYFHDFPLGKIIINHMEAQKKLESDGEVKED